MSFPTNWDVSKYKTNYESDEHWELRRKFIETHKERFPEDKLICLAQVFFNIEFLGCRYPEKTMRLVEELSQGVADEHREKQKGKLKRSFVEASDAAGDKIKRKSQGFSEPPKKAARHNLNSCFVHAEFAVPKSGTEQFPGFILYENCRPNGVMETCPLNILTHSTQKNQVWKNLTFDFANTTTSANEYQIQCDIKINNKLLASATGSSNKEAKTNAAIEGLKILRKSCYTIQAKHPFFSDNPEVSKEGKQSDTEKPIAQDNVGSRMMQKMGWTGSGLGKQQQGIQAPIQASSQVVQRSGFGRANGRELENKFKQVFKDFIGSSSDYDLVFTPDFSSDERKTLHRSDNVEDERSEEEADDLFSTNNITVESNSDEEESCECVMCEKLKFISGNEIDDDIYNMMWGSSLDPTGFLHRPETKKVVTEITDDETCNMDLFASEEDDLDIFMDYDSDELNSSGEKRVNNIMSHKQEKAKQIKGFLSKKTDKSMFRYFLPDNSCLYLNVKSIKEADLLYKYTYPYGETQVMRRTVSENDLVNIAGLRDLLFKHAVSHRFKPDKTTESPKTRRLKPQYDREQFGTNSSKSNTNIENQSTNRKDSFATATSTLQDRHLEDVHECLNKSLEFFLDSGTLPDVERQANDVSDNHKLPTTPASFHDKVKIFFLDGSYKYVSLDVIKDSEELREFTQYAPEKSADEMRCGVTIKDLKKYKSLREVFADIIAAYRLQFGTKETQSDTTHRSNLDKYKKPINMDKNIATDCGTTTGTKRKYYSLISSKNRTMKNVQHKGKIFLPDGSYKTILIKDIQYSEELSGIFNYYPGKPASELMIMVTVEEVKHHKSLQNLFSEYMIAQKSPIGRTKEVAQAPTENLSSETLGHPHCESTSQDKTKDLSFEVNRTLPTQFDKSIPMECPHGESHLTPGFTNIEYLNSSAPSYSNNIWVKSPTVDSMNQKSHINAAASQKQCNPTRLSTHLDRPFLMTVQGQRMKYFGENNTGNYSSMALNSVWPQFGTVHAEMDSASVCSLKSNTTDVGIEIQNHSNCSRNRPRIKVMFKDESFKRVNVKYFTGNKYYVRYGRKMKEIGALGLTMNDVPPADYSDASDEEDEYNKWDPRFMPVLHQHAKSDVEKHINEEGKLYLQNTWEKYLIKFATSFKNPYGQKWKEFLEQKSTEVDSIFALRDQWKEFMKLVKGDTLSENSPLNAVQEINTEPNFSINIQGEGSKKSEMLDPPPPMQSILSSNLPVTSHMTQLFGVDLNKSPFEEQHSAPPDLESHLNASTITMVDTMHLGTQFAEPSLVESMSLESHINASTVTIVDSIVPGSQMCVSSSVTDTPEPFPEPSQEQSPSKESKPVSRPKKFEDGINVGYLPDGSKIKFRQLDSLIVTTH